MKKISREKAALGFFAVLALAGLGVLIAYIVTVGHSLNIAASNIDDATGNLDGYTAILYKGTAEERKETVVDATQVGKNLSSHTLSKLSSQASAQGSDNEVSATQAANDSADSEEGEKSGPLTVFGLQCSYIEKGAHVFTLDLQDLASYNRSTVIRSGKFKYGIFSIDQVTAQESYFDKRVAEYKDAGVDLVICIVSDVSLLDSYEGANIVISAQNEGISPTGALVDGVFFDDAALIGQVGTVLVSPSKTITARDAVSL